MHQKIRPQTKTPTTSAAIVEPIHRSYILWACGLMPSARPAEVAERLTDTVDRTTREQHQQRGTTDTEPGEPSDARPCDRTLCDHLLLPPSQRRRADSVTPAARRDRRSHITRPGRAARSRGSDLRRPLRTPDHVDDTVRRVEDSAVPAGAAAYLDAATAAPLHPVARQALLAALDDGWADPGRLYAAGPPGPPAARRGRRPRSPIPRRTPRRGLLHRPAARPPRTPRSSAASPAGAGRARTLVHSAIEHSAVLHAAAAARRGRRHRDRACRWTGSAGSTWTPGATAVRAPGVALAALISASHEVGTVQPVAAAAEACAAAGCAAATSTPPSRWAGCRCRRAGRC